MGHQAKRVMKTNKLDSAKLRNALGAPSRPKAQKLTSAKATSSSMTMSSTRTRKRGYDRKHEEQS